MKECKKCKKTVKFIDAAADITNVGVDFTHGGVYYESRNEQHKALY